jgi:nicotinate-nucleotide adenylyltransferase
MKVGVYGISGNPPHNGHISVVRASLNHVDEVWVMPCYSHRHGKNLIDANDRLQMCELTFGKIERVKVDPFEIINKRDDGSYKVMLSLRRLFPNFEFWPIIGQDNANTISTWAFYEQFVKDFSFFIVGRNGVNRLDFPGVCEEIPCDRPAISSSEIRGRIKTGQPIDHMLVKEVLEYIRLKGLYLS